MEQSTISIQRAWRRVLKIEADAVGMMADHMPEDFEACVKAIVNLKGRLIVSGIGKSGHIGRKIVATLASTGTPSQFVHSTEASHGDLGMIGPDDMCLMISNSGETSELRDVLEHAKRFSIPLAAISSKPESTLMKAATYKLVLPAAPEACSIGMAPTTSTTLTLAMGDAIAVVLMELRGFQPVDFSVFHPGGKLGAQMMTAGQLMHSGPAMPIVEADTSMSETLLTMTSKGFGIAGVVRDGRLIGVISDGDLRRRMHDLMSLQAKDVATQDPVSIQSDTLAAHAMALLNEREIGALFVVDSSGRPEGVLNVHDLLRAGVA